MMSMQRNRSAIDHTVRVALSDRLRSVLLAFDRIAFAGNRLAVYHIGIRTCRDGAAVRRERITHHNDLTNQLYFPRVCDSVATPCVYIPIA